MGEIQYTKCIMKLANQIRRIYDISSERSGAQVRILYYILTNYPDRIIYQKNIEEEFNIRSATISAILKKLEENGMIVRERVPDDDRLKKVLPTPYAIDRKDKILHDIGLMEEQLISGINEKDLKVFFEVAQKMIKNMT